MGARSGGALWNRLSTSLAVAATILAVALGWMATRPEPVPSTTRVSVRLAVGQDLSGGTNFDLSADGTMMVYHGPGATGGSSALWLRRWDELEATPIPNTEGAGPPAISPDGREVAFVLAGTQWG